MKIDIFICKFGSGHQVAAKELEKYIEANKAVSIRTIDFIEAIHPKIAGAIYWGYRTYFQHIKGKKDKDYKNKDGSRDFASKFFNIKKLFFKYMDENPLPDIFISCYSVTSYLLSLYKEERNLDIPLITHITDFNFHKFWINDRTDLYLTMSDFTKNKLIDIGVDEDRIIIFGEKKNLSREKSDKNILICGGGLGMLPNDESFYRDLGEFSDKNFAIVFGKNKKLYQKISKLGIKNLKTYGLVENMADLYAWADIYITKPGGMSIHDSIRNDLPIIYFTPYLPQEIKNKNFIEKEKIGIELKNQRLDVIRDLFHDENKLETLRENLDRVRDDFAPEDLIRWMDYEYYKIRLNPYNNLSRPWLHGYSYS